MNQPSYRAKENRWTVWALTPEGKRVRPAYGKTKEEALQKKLKIEEGLRDARAVEVATRPLFPEGSFAAFVYDVYVPRTYESIKRSTQLTYDTELRLHILPALGHLKVSEIGYPDLQAMKSGLSRYRRILGSNPPRFDKTEEPLSPSESRELILRAKEILTLAKLMGLTSKEDWRLVKTPEKPGKRIRAELPGDFPTKLMAEAAKSGIPWMVGPLFCAQYLGLRRGEALGLKRSSIDRESLEITVSEQRQHLGGAPRDMDVKTKESRRTIGVPQEFIDHLDGLSDPRSIYLFTNNRNRPINPNTVTEETPRLCERAGLPRTTFHDLRSYASSNLHALGFDLLTIASILGHNKIDTTLLYVNVKRANQRQALKGLLDTLKLVDQAVDGGIALSV